MARNGKPGALWVVTNVIADDERDAMEVTYEHVFNVFRKKENKKTATTFFEWCGSRTVFN